MTQREYNVYVATNTRNGFKYVGQSWFPPAKRWSGHVQEAARGSAHALGRAIRADGPERFEVQHVLKGLTKAEADGWEAQLISDFQGRCYNETAGGPGTRGYRHSDQARALISAASAASAPRHTQARKAASTRMWADPEKRAAIIAAQAAGRVRKPRVPMSAEVRARIADSQRQLWASRSPEQRRERAAKWQSAGSTARRKTREDEE